MTRILLAFTIFCSIFGVSYASPDKEVEKLCGTIDAALDALYSAECAGQGYDVKVAKVREALESNYDLSVIIRRAIGRNWRQLDAEQQQYLLELVKQLVVKAYVTGMEGLERPRIEYADAILISEKRMEIPAVIYAKDNKINAIYRLGLMRSGWQIYDIVVENISVVSNYRQQIDDHFRKGNGSQLITKLENLLLEENIDVQQFQI